MLQHLVGAKLECALGEGAVLHHSHSTADEPGGRAGDFLIGDVAIHVTTAPGEAVIERCRENLNAGHQPLLVTERNKVPVAEGLAGQKDLGERIDIFEVETDPSLSIKMRP